MRLCTRVIVSLAALLLTVVVPALAQRQPVPDIGETLQAGSTGHEVRLRIVNEDMKPARDVAAAITGKPAGVVNARIEPAQVAEIAPGASATLRLLFDIAADAPNGLLGSIVLSFTAREGRLSRDGAIVGLAIDGKVDASVAAKTAPAPAAGDGPGGAPLLGLVAVKGPTAETYGRTTVVHRPGEAGAARVSALNDVVYIDSREITDAPSIIRLGEPFSVSARLRARRGYPDRHSCSSPDRKSANRDRRRRLGLSSKSQYDRRDNILGAAAEGTNDLQSYCLGPLKSEEDRGRWARKGAVDKDETIDLTLKYLPEDTRKENGSTRYIYRVEAVTGGRVVQLDGQPKLFFQVPASVKTDSEGYLMPGGYKGRNPEEQRLSISTDTLTVVGGSDRSSIYVRLDYKLIGRDDRIIEKLTSFQPPDELTRPARSDPADTGGGGTDMAGRGGTGDETPAVASGADQSRSGASGASGAQQTAAVDPAHIDAKNRDVAALIREWLRIAEPPVNARGGNARYNEWGQVVGQLVGSRTIRSRRPDGAEGMTPEEYVWARREALDSLNHCTLGTFVSRRLATRAIDDCAGAGVPPGLITLDNLIGMRGTAAKDRLEQKGLTVVLSLGPRAARADQSFSVRSQSPRAGTVLQKGDRVTLVVAGEYSSKVPLPDVSGMAGAAAKERLEKLGFTVAVNLGARATSPDRSFAVQSQSPAPGTMVEKGDQVALVVSAEYVRQITVPDVTGLSRDDAWKKLMNAGLSVELLTGPAATSARDAHRAMGTEPRAGSRADQGTTVTLTMYGAYVFRGKMPNLTGLTRDEAFRRIAHMRLRATTQVDGIAPHRSQSGRVSGQSIRPGSTVTEGAGLNLVLYGPSVAERLETADCSAVHGSRPIWLESRNVVGCACPPGFGISPDRRSCVRPPTTSRVSPGPGDRDDWAAREAARRAEEDRRRREQEEVRYRAARAAEARKQAMLRQECPRLYRQMLLAYDRRDQFGGGLAQKQAYDIGCDYYEMSRVLTAYNSAAAQARGRPVNVDAILRSSGVAGGVPPSGGQPGGTVAPGRGGTPSSPGGGNWQVDCREMERRGTPCPSGPPSDCILGMCP